MSLPFDDVDMEPLPASFLARLQPAGAFLQPSSSLRSPTATTQRQAPAITPLKAPCGSLPKLKGDVAMSFMSAMRRGLEGLQTSDSEDDDDSEEDQGYYQPAYSQYHAPTTSFTGRASVPLPTQDDDELIFPMEI